MFMKYKLCGAAENDLMLTLQEKATGWLLGLEFPQFATQ